jgi:DDE domain
MDIVQHHEVAACLDEARTEMCQRLSIRNLTRRPCKYCHALKDAGRSFERQLGLPNNRDACLEEKTIRHRHGMPADPIHHSVATPVFKGRRFEPEIIIFVRATLSPVFTQLSKLGRAHRRTQPCRRSRYRLARMAERNLSVDHVTVWRGVQRYAPELDRRCRRELRITDRSWRVDETYIRIAGRWTYLYRGLIPLMTSSISALA